LVTDVETLPDAEELAKVAEAVTSPEGELLVGVPVVDTPVVGTPVVGVPVVGTPVVGTPVVGVPVVGTPVVGTPVVVTQGSAVPLTVPTHKSL